VAQNWDFWDLGPKTGQHFAFEFELEFVIAAIAVIIYFDYSLKILNYS
jgi:hypothetical protein